MAHPNATEVARFWSHVAVRGPGDCWLWTASTYPSGYGIVRWEGRTRGTHRLAWELVYGPVTDNRFVCHHCDVRRCVNPAHLFLGTAAENLADMVAKGRAYSGARTRPDRRARGTRHGSQTQPERWPRGERHGGAALTPTAVRMIRRRAAAGDVQVGLAREYGLSKAEVSRIVARKRWASLPED